jgi:UDP-N-acetyl-D-glucosamine dehydrogenase
MPGYVVEVLVEALGRTKVPVGGSRILIIGLAYKKNVPDIRESPTFKLIELLEGRGSVVEYHDPYLEAIPYTREHSRFAGRRSVPLHAETIASFDAVIIATDHDAIDYGEMFNHARLIVDSRNAMGTRGMAAPHVVKA